MSDATANIKIKADPSQLPSGLRTALKMVQGFVHSTTGLLNPKKSKDPDHPSLAFGSFVGNLTSGLAMRGIDKMVAMGQEVFDFERELTRFGIAARKTPQEMRAMGDAARKTSSEIGINALEVLRAGRAYVDLAGAENFSIDMMNVLARAAQASGAATTDLAGMMYQLKVSMQVPDNEMEAAIGGLINQAKDGAIEAKQMATEFAAILPLFKRFGVVGREGAVQAGALFQVMRDGANTASEAGTMIQRVYSGIQSYAPRFEAQGVQIYEKFRDKLGRKVLLPFDVIFKNITNSKAMQDPALVKKMFGRTEGWRGLLLGDEASRAMVKFGGSVDGTVSRLEALRMAGRENGVVQQDLARFTESAAGRMDIAVEKLRNKFAEAFTPERIDRFVSALEDAADKIEPLVKAVGFIGDVLGGIYSAGKKVRGFLTPDDSRLGTPTMGEIQTEARQRGISEIEAERRLRERRGRYLAAKQAIADAFVDDKTTKESDKRAVAARFDTRDESGEGAQSAGAEYIEKAGLSPEKVAEIYKQILAERIDAEIAAGRGKSEASQDLVKAFKDAVRDTLAPAVSKAISDANDRPTQLIVDGNPLSTSVGNATNARRR